MKEMTIEDYSQSLSEGKVLAYPTETIWGLGVDILNETAMETLYELKLREKSKAISILIRDIRMAHEYAEIDEDDIKLMQLFWPGPLTLVLPAKSKVPAVVHAGTNMVGLRCSSHPFLTKLFNVHKSPISTTSANRSGQAPAHSFRDLFWLPDEVVKVLDNTSVIKNPGSSVIRKNNDGYEMLREGQIDFNLLSNYINLTKKFSQ